MYTESAAWYDRLHRNKNYAAESQRIVGHVRRLRPNARTLLDVACGTGGHLQHLRTEFTCEGVDVEGGLLEVARPRLPDVPLTQADMTDFDLGRRFDVVTCLYSAIGYVRTVDRMRAALRCMARHLEPGGVLIVEPWIQPDSVVDVEDRWVDGSSAVVVIEDDDLKLVRVRVFRSYGSMSELTMHYVAARDGEIVSGTERHRVAMFTREEFFAAAEAAGLAARWCCDGLTGRGLLIGVRTAEPSADRELPTAPGTHTSV
ncbi:N-dimethyltransferase [Amycolatopsis arida]|uniref:N-dimethyltransferase n=2 Tax=Amycolatopsis arida TaxID=587909 RepID=A0A1I5QAM8_9PSEU|nr:N-dimethyltransferase [Amycolatopsis arida]SFP43060.1 N-dimethyltransferase [Amycolatopsis arida]